jgi:hypothetical protein
MTSGRKIKVNSSDNVFFAFMIILTLIIFSVMIKLAVSYEKKYSKFVVFKNKIMSQLPVQKIKIKSCSNIKELSCWKITYVGKDGRDVTIEAASYDVKVVKLNTEKDNYVTFKYLEKDIIFQNDKLFIINKGYYNVTLYIKK